MSTQERNTHWAMLFVVGVLLLSGATRSREVAARAQGPERATQGSTPVPVNADVTHESLLVNAGQKAEKPALLSIAAGDYLPFYKGKDGARTRSVPAFRVAAQPVTRQEFLRFLRAEPRWRRSHVGRLFAEAAYLADWRDDLDPGASPLTSAVSSVSWFAAKAYCASVGMRLPTTVEWERALSVVGHSFITNAGGGGDSNPAASLWEWTADFNSLPVADGDSVATLFCGAGARATDATDYGAFLRYSFRSSLKADFTLRNLGFRCAEGAP